MGFYTGKSVLVTGGTGMIGRPLTELLLAAGAAVRVVSLDDPEDMPDGIDFRKADLREFSNCLDVCRDMEVVFHLAGVKGSPKMTVEQPASFMTPTIMFNTNVMEAARRQGARHYLYTSSIGVYAPAEVFHEDDVWTTFPSPHDRIPGWTKRMGELQAEAYRIQYDWQGVSIVRPANVYGPYDNFDPDNAMVIPALVHRALSGENPLVVWGDGSAVRDFIHARDVARGMMKVMEAGVTEPVNLGSGRRCSIRQIVDAIIACVADPPAVEWDTSKPTGDALRLMDTGRARAIGIEPEITIEDGVAEVVAWYAENRGQLAKRYNAFTDEAYAPSASSG